MAQAKKEEKIEKVKAPKTSKEVKHSHLVVDVYNMAGTVVGTETLNKDIFDKIASSALMAQALRVLSFNQRQGTVAVKDRSEVRGGGRKPWRQKGTGRARQGSIRSPQWRGGGVVHGPLMKDWSLDLNKKQRRAALIGALSLKARDNKIIVLQDLELKAPKTKEVAITFAKLPEVTGKRSLVVVDEKNDNVYLSIRNLPKTEVNTVNNLNTMDVTLANTLILTQKAISGMNTFFGDKEKK